MSWWSAWVPLCTLGSTPLSLCDVTVQFLDSLAVVVLSKVPWAQSRYRHSSLKVGLKYLPFQSADVCGMAADIFGIINAEQVSHAYNKLGAGVMEDEVSL